MSNVETPWFQYRQATTRAVNEGFQQQKHERITSFSIVKRKGENILLTENNTAQTHLDCLRSISILLGLIPI